ncbi:MAG: hypothetical protein H7A24_08740 [Leptospiraceae bacterium]|nr:hypothetical protein [Leptospiraceae bacterium]MCP5511954.1 hypothetical protein [Leptospiraceae bacterium]
MKVLFLLFMIFLSPIRGESLNIYFSSGIDGNVRSCTCTLVPLAGLSRRLSFLEKKKVLPMKDILIEGGGYLGNKLPQDKFNSLFESFLAMKYHFLGIQTHDLKYLESKSFSKFLMPIVTGNFASKKKSNAVKMADVVLRDGRKIAFTNILGKNGNGIPDDLLTDFDWKSPAESITKISEDSKYDFLILHLEGNEKDLLSLKKIINPSRTLVLFHPDTKVSYQKKAFPGLGTVYAIDESLGNRIYHWNLDTEKLTIQPQKTIDLDVDDLKDHKLIDAIADKYGI